MEALGVLKGRVECFNKLETYLKDVRDEGNKKSDDFEQLYVNSKEEITKQCARIVENAKNLESKLLSSLETGYSEERKKLGNRLKEAESLLKSVTKNKGDLEKQVADISENSKTPNISIEGNDVKEWIDKVTTLNTDMNAPKISFREKPFKGLKSADEIGDVIIQQVPFAHKLPPVIKIPKFTKPAEDAKPQPAKLKPKSEPKPTEEPKNPKKKQPKKMAAGEKVDDEGPEVEEPEKEEGGELLPGGELPMIYLYKDNNFFVITGNPHKLMLYNKKRYLIKEIKISTWPLDLCLYDGHLALSLYNDNKIEVYDAESLEKESETDVGGKCYSVCRIGGNFMVSFPRDKVVRKIADNGDILGTTEKKVLGRPTFLVSHPTKQQFLISDSQKHTIVCFSEDLRQLWMFVDQRILKDPRKMWYVDSGILVCGVWSDNIIEITDKGKYKRTVMNREVCGIEKPRSVYDNPYNDTMVMSEDGGKVKIFLKEDLADID